ncbi:unnamed protein product [Anisakis simplex]|uniref:Phage protein n=1 Tax=Anisakis simplex TaxID=6269 RepID=A0A0M3JCR7_ANISI|nr:unnamed protein product [Anisakis simplex]
MLKSETTELRAELQKIREETNEELRKQKNEPFEMKAVQVRIANVIITEIIDQLI